MPLLAAVRAEKTADRQRDTAIVLVLPPHWETDSGNEARQLEKYEKEYQKENVDVIKVQSDKAILGFYESDGPSDNWRILEEFADKPNRDSNMTPLFGPKQGTNVVKGQAFTHKAIMEEITEKITEEITEKITEKILEEVMDKVGSIKKITVFEDMDPYLAKAASKVGIEPSHIVGQSNHLMLLDADDGTYFNGKSDAFLVKANGNGHIGNVAAIQFSTEINTTMRLGDSLVEMKITPEHTAVDARKAMVEMLLNRGNRHDLNSNAEVPMAGCVMVSPATPEKDIDRGFYLYLNKYTNVLGKHIRERLNGEGTPQVGPTVIEAYRQALFVVCGTQAIKPIDPNNLDEKIPNAMHVAQAASFDGVTSAGFGGLSEMHYLISNDAYHGNLLVMPVQKQHEQETNADVLLRNAFGSVLPPNVDTEKDIAALLTKFDDMVSKKATTNDALSGKTMKPLFEATHKETKKATDKAVERLTTHGGMTADERRLLLLNFQTANDPKTKALRRINKVMIPALKAMKGGAYIVQTRMTAKVPTRYTAVDDLIKQLRDPMKANELLDLDVFTPEAHAECKRFANFLQEIRDKPSGPERVAAAKEFMYERYANEMFFVGY